MTIDCTLSIRDESGKYYINPYITLLSLFENTKESLRVHILHDDSIRHGKAALEELAARYGQEILFHRVPDFDPDFAAAISKWFNLGTMYRYFVADFIEADKVIYLDCDVIVNRDIKDLYDIPLQGRLIGAVKDNSHYWDKRGRVRPKFKEKIEYLKLTPDDCFEAGVMVFNLARLRELNAGGNIFMDRTKAALASGIDLQYPDQDIMNAVCKEIPNGLLLLDESFNSFRGVLDLHLDEMQGKIIQFIGAKKLDEKFFPGHLVYWKYYAMSPFAGDMIERLDATLKSKPMAFLTNYARRPSLQGRANDLLAYGFWGMLWKALLRALGIKK